MKYTLIFLSLISIFIISFSVSGCESSVESKGALVQPPSLVSPPDYNNETSLTPLFQWSGNGGKIEIAKDQGFTNVIHTSDVTGEAYQMPEGILQPNTYYYWKVGSFAYSALYWSSFYFTFRTGGQ